MLQEVVGVLSLLIASGLEVTSSSWSYSNPKTDPSQWPHLFPVMCSGWVQSPINLNSSAATYLRPESNLTVNISMNNFWKTPSKLIAENTGHSLTVYVTEGAWLITLNNQSENYYKVQQFHFHWGSDSTTGSEHTVDDRHFPLEMHIEAYSSMYANFSVARTAVEGLTVVSVFFNMTDNQSDSTLSKMGNLLSMIEQVKPAGSKANVTYFKPEVLLPENKEFFRYLGSLTTPPCTENVQWTVMRHPLNVTEADLEKFRSLLFGEGDGKTPMQDNFRPVQPLNPVQAVQPRVLYKSWPSASHRLAASLFVIALGLTFIKISS